MLTLIPRSAVTARNAVFRKLHTCATYSATEKRKPKQSDSFVKNAFLGKIEGKEVFPFPRVLTPEQEEETRMMVDQVAKFCESHDAAKYDVEGKFDEETFQKLRELGAYGMMTPQEYDGVGLTNTQFSRVAHYLGYTDLAMGVHLGAHQSIGYKGIVLFGTDEQKAKYIPKLATGEQFAAFALTEPGAGSDAANIKTRAVLSDDGSHYILNGSKIWITNGGFADVYTVFTQTEMIDEKSGEKKDGVTAFIVEKAFGGVTAGPPEKKLGINASNTTEVFFDNVKVPAENLLGKKGEGFKVAMNILNAGRFGMAGSLSGTMVYAIQKSLDFLSQRQAFGKKVYEFQDAQSKLAEMAALQYATEALAYILSGNMDKKSPDFILEAAIGKVFASDNAWFCVDTAIQLHGGMGYMRATGLERMLRDARIFRIFEGANDVLTLFIGATGLMHTGSHLTATANSGIRGQLGMIVNLMSVGKKFKANSLQRSANLKLPAQLAPHKNRLIDLVSRFGDVNTELLLKYKKTLIQQENAVGHIGAAAIQIYALSCALSRCADAIERKDSAVDQHIDLCSYFFGLAVPRANEHLIKASSNSVFADDVYLRAQRLTAAMIEKQDTLCVNPLGF